MKKMIMLIGILLISLTLLGCEAKKENGMQSLPEESKEEWGLKITAKDTTKTGLTLVFEHTGEWPGDELITGEDYRLFVLENDEWFPVEYAVDIENLAWNSLAYIINENAETEMKVDWDFLYGKLSKGTYAIEKEVTSWSEGEDSEDALYYIIFEIK